MFSLIFTADLGKQGSAVTTPFLTGISEAVFRSERPPSEKEWKRRVDKRRAMAKVLAESSSWRSQTKTERKAHPAI